MTRDLMKPLASSLAIVVLGANSTWVYSQEVLQRTNIESKIDEIVVTAEHRTASLQDTKISLAVLSSDDLEQRGISNAGDISPYVPNVTMAPLTSGRTGFGISIRGIGEFETLVTADPAVGLYVDDVLIPKNTGSLLDVLDIERMEVLRGPQGTLYGRNTMGGAVNVVTRKPSDIFEAKLKATIGDFKQRDLSGVVNIPLMGADSSLGSMSLKLTAASLNRDGFQNNVAQGAVQEELDTKDREIATAKLLWQPTNDIDVMYSYDRTRIDEVPQVVLVTNVNPEARFGPLSAPFLVGEDRPEDIQVNSLSIAKTEADGHSLHIDYALSETMTIKSITGKRKMENTSAADSDGTTLNITDTGDEMNYDFFSQEFRLVGTLLDDQLEYSVGYFYMEEEGALNSRIYVFGTPDFTIADFDNKSWAVYGQATYHITERLGITGGVRYSEDSRKMSKTYVARSGAVTNLPDASKDFDNVSPMVSISYHWSDDIMGYGKVSTGYQSGGFNVRDNTPQDFTRGFDEETLVAYELGLKSTINDRIRFNAALWFSDYDDKRVSNFNPETFSSTIRNAGVIEIYGVELEALLQMNDFWQVGLNYGHTKPEYVEYTSPDPDNPGETIDLSDVTNFPRTPENQASVFVAYEHPLNFGIFRARLDWTYQDETTFLSTQPEPNSQEAYDLWNARVTLEDLHGPGNSRIKVSAWVKNLTDEGYWVYGGNTYFTALGVTRNIYGEPRTLGVDISIDF